MRLTSSNPDETEKIGLKLGRILKKGNIVGIYGDLGSGKTTMVRGIAQAFGIDKKDITSASYTIIAEYQCDPPFYHIDLYRLEGKDDIFNAGIWDCLGGNSISVIEWAEKAGDEIPEDAVKIMIETTGAETRKISIEGVNEKDWHNI